MLCNEVGESQLYIDDTIDMDFAVVEQSVLEAKFLCHNRHNAADSDIQIHQLPQCREG